MDDMRYGGDALPILNQNFTIIKQAVVLEVVDNPVQFKDDAFLNSLVNRLENAPTPYLKTRLPEALKKQLKMAPRNSVVAILLDDTDGASSRAMVFYPLFSQHLSLPVKPGENVWIISEALQNSFSVTKTQVSPPDLKSAVDGELVCSGYWMSRVVSPDYADDINFTHADRSRSQEYIEQQKSDQKGPLALPSFHNGIFSPGSPNDTTLPSTNDYSRIYVESPSNRRTTREPVPEFTKRPGDIVIQGSNNALICVGEDRPDTGDGTSNANYKTEAPLTKPRLDAKAGTIDIVAGRALIRNGQSFEYDPKKITTVANTREGETEKEKRSWAEPNNEPSQKINEGDISFIKDLSRVYISMKTDGDKNLGYEEPKLLPKIGEEFPSTPVDSSAYVISRAKEIRIVAAQERDEEGAISTDVATAGSIRIIKEGTRDEEGHSVDQGVIQFNPDGALVIDGPSIIIGSGKEGENGAGNQVFIGNNATEPLVLGNELKKLLDKHFDDLKAEMGDLKSFLQSGYNTHVHPTGVGPSGPPVVLAAANITAITQFEAAIDTAKGNTSKILSKNAKTK